MKKALISLLFVIVLVFVAPTPALAQTDTGPVPGSFWYGITTTFENVNLFFTFNAEKKAEKALNYAERHLIQAKIAVENENTDATEIALTDYEEKLTLATKSSKKIEDNERAEKLLTTIADNTARHQETLSQVLEKVPKEAREAITKAIEASKRGQEEAMQKIAELKDEVEKLKQEVAELKQDNKDEQIAEIKKLKQEVEELKKKPATAPPVVTPTQTAPTQKKENTQSQITPKTETPKTTTVTLPSGAILEMDEDGNIVRTIKEAPVKPVEQSASKKISTDSLGSELLKFLNIQLTKQIKSNLDYYTKTISDVRDLINLKKDIAQKGKQNCLASYESKVWWVKDDAKQERMSLRERGSAGQATAALQQLDARTEKYLEDIERWKESCLAQYEIDASLDSRLSRVNNDLESAKQRFDRSSTSVSISEVNSVRNEIISIVNVLAGSAGVSGSVSLPTIQNIPSSVTCTDSLNGFSCRDNFGSNVMRCSQTSPGFLNCTDSNFNNVSCQTGVVPGSMRCSW